MDYLNIERLIAECKGTILDVRTVEEFEDERVPDSVNIPLQEIQSRIGEIENLPKPIILCCASGSRSGVAEIILSQIGIECCNAGSWLDVGYIKSHSNLTE